MTYRHASYKVQDLPDSTEWRSWRGTGPEDEEHEDVEVCNACDQTVNIGGKCRCLSCDWCGLLPGTAELGPLVEIPFDVPSLDGRQRITGSEHLHASCAEEQRRKESGPVVGIKIEP